MSTEMLRSPQAIWVERDGMAGTLHAPLELLVLAFAHATRAEEALQELNELRRDHDLEIEDAVVLTRDAYGAGGFKDATDVVPRQATLLERARGAVMRLLPGPLRVLTGGSVRAGADPPTPTERTFRAWDPNLLVGCLAVDSSVLMLLIERQWVGDLIELISRVAIARHSSRLQVTLDDTIDRVMAQLD
jgi:hypothetical protein